MDMISSDKPAYWTKLVDLTDACSSAVQDFNDRNPRNRITLLGKCEFLNPGMSHKDRIAKVMLERAEARGELTNPKTGGKKKILAASSGNTGCSLGLVGTLMGYEVCIITDAKCSLEKCTHISANGATLWLAEDLNEVFPEVLKGETDYMAQEDLLVEAFPDEYFSVNQYGNPDNMDAHELATGPEIWAQTGGAVTHFVMASSTGGTIMGVGKHLKAMSPDVEVVLADPEKSRLAGFVELREDPLRGEAALAEVEEKIRQTGGVAIEGAGKGELTGIMMRGGVPLKYIDRAIPVNDFDAFDQCRAIAAKGLLVGGSAGLNIAASKLIAADCAEEQPREGGVTIVTLLCDHGIKYLSKIFNDDWMSENDTR
jgi:cysteine synthase